MKEAIIKNPVIDDLFSRLEALSWLTHDAIAMPTFHLDSTTS